MKPISYVELPHITESINQWLLPLISQSSFWCKFWGSEDIECMCHKDTLPKLTCWRLVHPSVLLLNLSDAKCFFQTFFSLWISLLLKLVSSLVFIYLFLLLTCCWTVKASTIIITSLQICFLWMFLWSSRDDNISWVNFFWWAVLFNMHICIAKLMRLSMTISAMGLVKPLPLDFVCSVTCKLLLLSQRSIGFYILTYCIEVMNWN